MTNKDAAAIAFLSNSVDIFVTDWIWVSKQKDIKVIKFHFYLILLLQEVFNNKNSSEANNLYDLKNKRLGVAGGSIDMSRVIFQSIFLKNMERGSHCFF